MIEYRIPIANVLSAVILLLCYVIALILINVRAERKARVLGVAGVLVLFLGTVLGELNSNLGLWFSAIYGPRVNVYNPGTALVTAVSVIGMLLLVFAVVAARKAARKIGN
jgi:hypothetical protein